jgi:hypothetical protein
MGNMGSTGITGTTNINVRRAGYRAVGRFGVMVHPEGEMLNRDWEDMVVQIRAHFGTLRMMVIWADGSLTPRQRSSIRTLREEWPVDSVMFTDSAITRGVVRVLQWFGAPVRVFPKTQLLDGLQTIGATADETRIVLSAIHQLECEISQSPGSDSRLAVSSRHVKVG